MPRIRKKTSKRTKTHERVRLHKKIKENKRKKARDAKKNPQWKSKHKKDPGIPNDFPYKDQVLAELQEERRLAAEERERKKEKRVKKAENVEREGEDSDNEESTSRVDEVDDKDSGVEGIGSISTKRIANCRISTRPVPMEVDDVEEEEEEEDIPMLVNRDLPNLQSVLDQADGILQVLDARDPLSFRSTKLEEVLASKVDKRLLFVLNKIDVSPREAVKAWSSALRRDHPTLLFRSATAFLPENPRIPMDIKGKRKASEPSDDAVGVEGVLKYLSDWAKQKNGGPFVVAVVGVANAGKSSFVNSILKRPALPIYTPSSRSSGPTTTFLPQEVTLDINGSLIRIIDTPGFSWEFDKAAEDAAKLRCHDILIRNRGRIDRLKDPSPPVAEIIARSNTEDLMLFYSLPAFPKGDVDAFLSGVARAQQLVKKRGTLDIPAATRMVLRDWNLGKFRYYSMPPVEQNTSSDDKSDQELYAGDEAILSALLPRKDMRKAGGLVKLRPGQVDSRWLVLEGEYVDGDDEYSSERSEEEDGEIQIEEGTADDLGGDEDEDTEEEALPVKQKRKQTGQDVSPPKKKVAFSLDRKKPSKFDDKPTRSFKSVSRKVASNSSKPKPADAGRGGEAYDFGRFF